jgi:tetratricopeptide (TPR) repeat protein
VAERMTGELEAARARLVALVENDKQEAALLQELARVCFALDDFAASLKALEALGEAPPLPRAVVASCVLMKVRALHHLNRLDDGIRVAEEWVRRHGESAGLTSALATLYLDAGRVREARDLFTAAESRGVADAEMLTTGGFVALNDGDAEAANDRFQRALAQQPGIGRAQLGLGLVSAARGDAIAARDFLERATEAMPTHLGSWLARAWFHFLANDLDIAEAIVHKALDINRNFADSHGLLAVIAARRGDLDKARELIRTGRRLDPRSLNVAVAATLVQHGGRMETEGFLQDALQMFQDQALSQNPAMRASFLRMLATQQAKQQRPGGR